jgi:precorrin-2 methylase
MKELLLIGIGAGDPDYITMQALKALRRADVIFLLDKGSAPKACSRSANARLPITVLASTS